MKMKTPLKDIIEEVKQYETERKRNSICGISTVQAVNSIVFNGVYHAGVVSHICAKEPGHSGFCQCCSYEWKGK